MDGLTDFVRRVFAENAPVDDLLAIGEAVLLVLVAFALAGTLRMRSRLRGRRGYTIATVMAVVIAAVLFSQGAAFVATIFRLYDRPSTQDARAVIIFVGDVVEATAIVWALRRIARMGAGGGDRIGPDDPVSPGPEAGG